MSEEGASVLMSVNVNVSQRTMTAHIEAAAFDKLHSRGEATDRARLLAYSAPWSDGWLKVVPNDVFDTHLSNRAFQDTVALRLEVEAFSESSHCPYCRQVMDLRGHHCAACMAGGDHVVQHNVLRNTVHREAIKATLRPELEKNGLLSSLGWPGVGGRRPADTLLVSGACLATTSRRRFPKTALDFADVSPLTPGVIRSAAQ